MTFAGARIDGIFAVFGLLVAHLLDDGAAPGILPWQAAEMAFEVLTDLTFGLRDEPETPLVAEYPAGGADGEGTRVPEWTEPADIFAELLDTLLAPGKMIELLVGGALHLCLDALVACDRSVALVERLGTDLTRMIDAHHAGRVSLLSGIEVGIDDVLGGVSARCATGRRGDSSQGIVGAGKQAIQRRQLTFFHARDYS